MKSRTKCDSIQIAGINFPTICSPVRLRVKVSYTHLRGLELADYHEDDKDDTIDILIGADHYWDFITGDIVRGESGPTAISSRLGFLLSGRTTQSALNEHSAMSNLILPHDPCPNSAIPNRNDDVVESLKLRSLFSKVKRQQRATSRVESHNFNTCGTGFVFSDSYRNR